MDLTKLYKKRFDEAERIQRNSIWKVLCSDFFQKYIPKDGVVVDIGAGYCDFINNIRCAEKYAVDMNEEIPKYAASGVRIIKNSATAGISVLADNSVDAVFMSNVLEHFHTKEEILKILAGCFRVLRPAGGRIMILGPNISHAYREYWDFFDHHVPLSDKSVVEALSLVGFDFEKIFPQFLPYTTKSKFSKVPFLVKTYLRMPFMWKIFGKQMFILARKK